MRYDDELPGDRHEPQRALVPATSWRPASQAVRTVASVQCAPTAAEVRRAAAWLRWALWRVRTPTRPQ